MLWKFITSKALDNMCSVDVTHTVELRGLRQKMIRVIVILMRSNMVIGDPKGQIAAIDHDVFKMSEWVGIMR